MNTIVIKNGDNKRTFVVPHTMIRQSSKLELKYLSREQIIITDVDIPIFDAFVSLFTEYYNNNADSTSNIDTITEKIFSGQVKTSILKLTNFVNDYDFKEIRQAFKKYNDELINSYDLEKIRRLFDLNDDLSEEEKFAIISKNF